MRRALQNVFSLDGSVDAKEAQRRRLFLTINVTVIMFMCFVVPSSLSPLRFGQLFPSALALFVAILCVVYVLAKRPLSTAVIVTTCYTYALGVFVSDVNARTVSIGFMWILVVIIVDLLLVLQVHQRYSIGLVVVTVVWLVVMQVEARYRGGVFDVPGLYPQDVRFRELEKMCSCASPPCANTQTTPLMMSIMVFIVDFIATRGFARDVLKEQATMERTIDTVQEIATLLAGYDVEQVAALLEQHGADLPVGMTVALRRLEQNLRVYKAYLPATCLPFAEEEDTDTSVTQVSSTSSSFSGGSASSTHTGSSIDVKQDAVARVLGLTFTKATLFTVNVKDTLRLVSEDGTRFSELFTAVLLNALNATATRHGMVDVFVGDRVHCSFNASRKCANHATSALHAATVLRRTGGEHMSAAFNVGIATGKLLRGDMGCEVMRRFSMVGTLVRDVHLIERAGRVFGCGVLCNRICFSDAECEHDLRLLPCKVEVSQNCEAEIVAELVLSDNEADIVDDDEWMYVIGGEKRWDAYNTAVRGYLRGAATAEQVAAEAAKGDCADTPLTVAVCARVVLKVPVYEDVAKQ